MTVELASVERGPASARHRGRDAPPIARLGIAGIGLIGGSIALAVREKWPSVRITGCDRPDRIEEGQRRGIVDAVAATAADLATADLIVLAVPMATMSPLIDALGAASVAGLVTDVGSTKREVMAAVARAGLRRFVGGHPMAGAERAGLDHARVDLFRGRPWLLAEGAADPDASLMEAFVTGLGAIPRWMPAEVHDRTMAYVSHLPQLLATALMNVATDAVGEDGLAAAGPAFAEMTRLASSPSDLWQGILAQNADFTAEAIERFIACLPDNGGLASGDWVREAFARAGAARGQWRPKDTR
jgi:prephenate dehydrogenase